VESVVGTYHDGRVDLGGKVDWPDGTRVRVEPEADEEGFLSEDNWPTTPEGIEALVRHMTNFEAVELTAEDEARIAAARAATREASIAAVRKQMGLDP
jgi:hypothetical protein